MINVVILGDGMSDRPIKELGGHTPLERAKKPNIDKLASLGQVGLVKTIPEGFSPGSDVANLSVMGYPPQEYYTGRSPLEALSMGVNMEEGDIAIRTNLVTLSDDKVMLDYSAGEITTKESKVLLEDIKKYLDNSRYTFYSGVSYRHCLIVKGGSADIELTPPHDISGKVCTPYMPKGENGELSIMIEKSHQVLKNHPINARRIKEGKNPATHIWFWGAGTKPKLFNFKEKYQLDGTVISAVDLLRGIARGGGMDAPFIPTATGTLDTDIDAKTNAVMDAIQKGKDYIYLHIEAPDECSHQGDIKGKIKAIELVDTALQKIWAYLEGIKKDYAILLLPDHATPLELKTHSSDAVPYIIYKSNNPALSSLRYTEKDAQKGVYLSSGQKIILELLKR